MWKLKIISLEPWIYCYPLIWNQTCIQFLWRPLLAKKSNSFLHWSTYQYKQKYNSIIKWYIFHNSFNVIKNPIYKNVCTHLGSSSMNGLAYTLLFNTDCKHPVKKPFVLFGWLSIATTLTLFSILQKYFHFSRYTSSKVILSK